MRTIVIALASALLARGAEGQDAKKNPVVVLDTTMGKVEIELYPDKAPATVKNFLGYVEKGFYDGTVFHRVISDFMIQGGGFDRDMKQKETDPAIRNEADNGLKNERGTIAMARTSDPHSATAQFFVNVKDNAFLDHTAKTMRGWGYCVFGKVVEGMDVIDKIKAVRTVTRGMHENVPETPVVINAARVKKDEPEKKK